MKNRFILTRQNQKGQVALFVALIFQVVFIFFALLINVGLLVHHKINLQQSTDMAAYYGAMKQAEILNAISHINFQMRQAWKLLTWRYRIFGTFGLQTYGSMTPPLSAPQFPMMLRPLGNGGQVEIKYNVSNAENIRCPNIPDVDLADVPFFCVGHNGIQGWNPSQTETFCKVSCRNIGGLATEIQRIPLTGGSSIPFGGSVGSSANQAISSANRGIQSNCTGVGPKSVTLLANLIFNYFKEVSTKKRAIQILSSNLSLPSEQSLDIEKKSIKLGAKNTFLNNLTEANNQSNTVFEMYNSLDRTKNSPCGYQGNSSDGEGNVVQFLKEIKFNFLQYFVQTCTTLTPNSNLLGNINISSIFDNTFTRLAADLKDNLRAGGISDSNINEIERILVSSNYILGYEKNPWCQIYTAVKSESKPKIPFLPLSTIKLSAVSVAKPFGGQIGPWYNDTWAAGAPNSTGSKNEESLPIQNVTADPNLNQLINIRKILPNYSRYVSDRKGLADKNVIASYHSMLAHRHVLNSNIQNLSWNKELSSTNQNFTPPTTWPSFSSWDKIKEDVSSSSYDYLATSIDGNKNSPLRDIEISVIAPNQFDLANYSIDADFYNNYYLKLKDSISAIQSTAASGISFDPAELRPDYGYNSSLANNGIPEAYSIRHQIQVASQIIKETGFYNTDGAPTDFKTIFNFLPDNMATLLTGWTYADFNNYRTFPNQPLGDEYTMTFGKCADPWTQDPKSFASPVDSNLPPTPGNCVTGGRVGYSVKLISPNMVRSGNPQPLGGPGTTPGDILNPIDPNFLQF